MAQQDSHVNRQTLEHFRGTAAVCVWIAGILILEFVLNLFSAIKMVVPTAEPKVAIIAVVRIAFVIIIY